MLVSYYGTKLHKLFLRIKYLNKIIYINKPMLIDCVYLLFIQKKVVFLHRT